MGQEAARRLVLEIVKLSRRHDCNSGEILDEIGGRLRICWMCLTAQADLVDGMCLSCRQREGLT